MSQVFTLGETVKVKRDLCRTERRVVRGFEREKTVPCLQAGATGVVIGQEMGCPVVRFQNGYETPVMPYDLRHPNWYDALTRGEDGELRDETGALAFGPSVVTGAI